MSAVAAKMGRVADYDHVLPLSVRVLCRPFDALTYRGREHWRLHRRQKCGCIVVIPRVHVNLDRLDSHGRDINIDPGEHVIVEVCGDEAIAIQPSP